MVYRKLIKPFGWGSAHLKDSTYRGFQTMEQSATVGNPAWGSCRCWFTNYYVFINTSLFHFFNLLPNAPFVRLSNTLFLVSSVYLNAVTRYNEPLFETSATFNCSYRFSVV
jgi:hypothetical protein